MTKMVLIITLILKQVDITVEEEKSTRQRLAVESEVVDQRTGLDKRFISLLEFNISFGEKNICIKSD